MARTREGLERRAAWGRAHAKNPEVRERTKIVRNTDAGRQKRNAYAKIWRKRPEVKARLAANQRARRLRDPLFAVAGRIRARLLESIRLKGFTKRSRLLDILGCDWHTLKEHFERLFPRGMTWVNRHLWEVDHVFPISSAKTEREVLLLSHYTNLQPLWRPDNRAKGAKTLKRAMEELP